MDNQCIQCWIHGWNSDPINGHKHKRCPFQGCKCDECLKLYWSGYYAANQEKMNKPDFTQHNDYQSEQTPSHLGNNQSFVVNSNRSTLGSIPSCPPQQLVPQQVSSALAQGTQQDTIAVTQQQLVPQQVPVVGVIAQSAPNQPVVTQQRLASQHSFLAVAQSAPTGTGQYVTPTTEQQLVPQKIFGVVAQSAPGGNELYNQPVVTQQQLASQHSFLAVAQSAPTGTGQYVTPPTQHQLVPQTISGVIAQSAPVGNALYMKPPMTYEAVSPVVAPSAPPDNEKYSSPLIQQQFSPQQVQVLSPVYAQSAPPGTEQYTSPVTQQLATACSEPMMISGGRTITRVFFDIDRETGNIINSWSETLQQSTSTTLTVLEHSSSVDSTSVQVASHHGSQSAETTPPSLLVPDSGDFDDLMEVINDDI